MADEINYKITKNQIFKNSTQEGRDKYIVFYFQVHQPCRLRHYQVFDIGVSHNYFDDKKNEAIFNKVARKSYLPMNSLLLELLHKYEEFKISFSLTGVFVEQAQEYNTKVLESFDDLIATGKVELLDETYYHSLASMIDEQEFIEQIKLHNKLMKQVFNFRPSVFRNTELIYNNRIGSLISRLGYKAILAEGTEKILHWRSPNYVYRVKDHRTKLLLKNYKLSDDIAFRFSNRNWEEWPLTADKYSAWLRATEGEVVNLFMDYETFGEHQWASTGIFDFMKALPKYLLENNIGFMTPSEEANLESKDEIDVPFTVSWADTERDLTAWLGNTMQKSAFQELYAIKKLVLATKNEKLIHDWRKLQTSDHFYYMCTKWFSDGDVHKYFNPYDSPYDSFIIFNNVLNDLIIRAKEILAKRQLTNQLISQANGLFSRNITNNSLDEQKRQI